MRITLAASKREPDGTIRKTWISSDSDMKTVEAQLPDSMTGSTLIQEARVYASLVAPRPTVPSVAFSVAICPLSLVTRTGPSVVAVL